MRVLWKSIKAWLISVPALILLFFLLFPPSSRYEFDETLGFMLIAVMFLGLPLFLVILIFNAAFNRGAETVAGGDVSASLAQSKRSPWLLATIGFALAGGASIFIEGIIWEVWLIFAFIGALLGFIAGWAGR